MKTPHRWVLDFRKDARQDLHQIPTRSERAAVLRTIRVLLESDNPYAVSGIKKVQGNKFNDVWRQRQGDYRILFSLATQERIHNKYSYKGTLSVIAILRRNEKTYRP